MLHTSVAEKLLVDALFSLASNYRSSIQNISIKNTVKLVRMRLRMSQRTLAKRAGIPQSTISRIESGKSKPSMSTLEKIFKALFCDLVLVPVPQKDIDLIVSEQIHHLAKKRVQYLKGTMALELQQPKDEVIQEFIAREEKELHSLENFDIWQDGET